MNIAGGEDKTSQNSELVLKPLKKVEIISSVSYILII